MCSDCTPPQAEAVSAAVPSRSQSLAGAETSGTHVIRAPRSPSDTSTAPCARRPAHDARQPCHGRASRTPTRWMCQHLASGTSTFCTSSPAGSAICVRRPAATSSTVMARPPGARRELRAPRTQWRRRAVDTLLEEDKLPLGQKRVARLQTEATRRESALSGTAASARRLLHGLPARGSDARHAVARRHKAQHVACLLVCSVAATRARRHSHTEPTHAATQALHAP
jgi:hypothetical protein